jgi:hypothetical protein
MTNNIYFDEVERRNGWTILRRYGAATARLHLPRYAVYSPVNRAMADFHLLRYAQQWCDRNNEDAPTAR